MADSSLNIKVGAIVDTKEISKQLASMPKQTITITPVFNTKGIQIGQKAIKDFADEFGNSVRQVDMLDASGNKIGRASCRERV